MNFAPLLLAIVVSSTAFAIPPVKCSKLKIKELFRAHAGSFSVPNGLSNEEFSGMVGREPVKLTGCVFEASAGDSFLVQFDASAKDKLRFSSHFETQCVDAEKPNGKFLGYRASASVSGAKGKAWTPPCAATGLTPAEKKVCSKGSSNSERSDAFEARMTKEKRYALDFLIQGDANVYTTPDKPTVGTSTQATTAAEVAPSGKVFCQLFDVENKDVVLAFTFQLP